MTQPQPNQITLPVRYVSDGMEVFVGLPYTTDSTRAFIVDHQKRLLSERQSKMVAERCQCCGRPLTCEHCGLERLAKDLEGGS